MSEYCIQTNNSSKVFDGKLALNKVNLKLSKGGVNAIVGSNVAGKSTLFKILLGMMTPSVGNASILGCDSRHLTSDTRSRIGYVNEEHALPGWMQVEQVINYQRQFYRHWEQPLLQAVLGYFNVDPKQKVSSLSRGERAGVNLAMAFAQKPELLILDEPTLGLDVIAKQSFLEAMLFTEMNFNTTFIYCAHQMDEIQRVADNLIIMEQGQVQHNSDPDAFSDRIRQMVCRQYPQWQQLRFHPKILKVQPLDDLLQIWVLDHDIETENLLVAQGGQILKTQGANLEQAVNAFLTRRHSTPETAVGV